MILVAEVDGALVGLAAAGHARGDDEHGLGELYSIHVDPPAWGQGAGRALLAAATAWLDARFSTSILWVVDRNRRARTLYERAGWSLDGATKIETYDGTSVDNCRYRRAAPRPLRASYWLAFDMPDSVPLARSCIIICVRTVLGHRRRRHLRQRRHVEGVDLEHVGVRLAAGAGAEVAVTREAVDLLGRHGRRQHLRRRADCRQATWSAAGMSQITQ